MGITYNFACGKCGVAETISLGGGMLRPYPSNVLYYCDCGYWQEGRVEDEEKAPLWYMPEETDSDSGKAPAETISLEELAKQLKMEHPVPEKKEPEEEVPHEWSEAFKKLFGNPDAPVDENRKKELRDRDIKLSVYEYERGFQPKCPECGRLMMECGNIGGKHTPALKCRYCGAGPEDISIMAMSFID